MKKNNTHISKTTKQNKREGLERIAWEGKWRGEKRITSLHLILWLQRDSLKLSSPVLSICLRFLSPPFSTQSRLFSYLSVLSSVLYLSFLLHFREVSFLMCGMPTQSFDSFIGGGQFSYVICLLLVLEHCHNRFFLLSSVFFVSSPRFRGVKGDHD